MPKKSRLLRKCAGRVGGNFPPIFRLLLHSVPLELHRHFWSGSDLSFTNCIYGIACVSRTKEGNLEPSGIEM